MPIQADRIAAGLAAPLFAASPPGDPNRLFVVEKESGRIAILDLATNQVAAQAFFQVPFGELTTDGERGLLGLAFHPDYVANGKLYLNLTNEAGDTEVWEVTRSGDPNAADPASVRVLMTVDRTNANHNGGWMGFGPDAYLYIASGDSGGSGDPENAAQNINDLRGKMLRIDVNVDAFPSDPSRNYGIPTDNPFVGADGSDEVFAYGLRNPWRASFDSETGALYIADVGEGAREEINHLAPGTGAGVNFGWRFIEGSLELTPPSAQLVLRGPVAEYGHGLDDFQGFSVTGGYVYHGPGGAQGVYFFADFVSNHLFTLRIEDGDAFDFAQRDDEVTVSAGTLDQIASFAVDGSGRLYAIGLDGEIFRLTPADDETSLPAQADDNDHGFVESFVDAIEGLAHAPGKILDALF
jgi:hypothetical protein